MKSVLISYVFLFSVHGHPTIRFDLSEQETNVEFLAVGKPAMIKIKGDGGKITGLIEIQKNQILGNFKLAIATLSTGIGVRDQHMKEKYLQAEKFPEAVFTISKIDLPLDFLNQNKIYKAVTFEGRFKIKDIENEIKGLADIQVTAKIINTATEFKIKITDYKIDIPTYLGIKVADDVTIKTFIKFKR